ncbi:unnamed protein product, partial [Meganyctiphanes norvegica]
VKEYTDNQDPDLEFDSDIVSLFAETTPMLDVIRWFQQHQLLKFEMKCDHCEHDMSWKTDMIMKKYKEGFYWKCVNKSCPKFYCRKNIKAETVFERSKICLKKWLHIIYKWSKNVGVTSASDQINIDHKTLGQCYSFFREICEAYFKANPIKLGGPGITIEIDVSFITKWSHRSKSNRGPEPKDPILALGIVDTTCTPAIGYMEIVETNDVATLFPMILKVVQPGSIIRSKDWRAYRTIQGISCTDETVNHSVNFVDVDTSVHKQAIESYWEKHKSYIAAMRSCTKNAVNSYLQEFMWRERFSDNALEILCEQIALQYSDASYIDNTDGSCLRKETETLNFCVKVELEESTIFLEGLPRIQEPEPMFDSDIVPSRIQEPEPKFDSDIVQPRIQEPKPKFDSDISPIIAESTPMLDVIRWFQQHHLLKSKIKCEHCEHFMSWKIDLVMKKYKEGFYWKCENRSCPKFYCRKNIKAGSVFERSKICLRKWLHIVFKWSKNVGVTAASEEINIDSKTMGQCYSFFREICEAYFKTNPIKLGGPGVILEIDVSFIFKWSNKPKSNRNPEPKDPILALGIVDTTCSPASGYMEVVETRDVATLLPMILKVVQPGSIIRSKDWRAYRKIQDLSNADGTVNQSVNFVDIDTSMHKQAIESYWEKQKSSIQAMRCFTKSTVNSYLQEFMWRERFSDNALEILCEQIALQYSEIVWPVNNIDGSHLEKETVKSSFCLKVKLEENTNSLEEPPHKKRHATIPQGDQSLFDDSISQEFNASDVSYASNTNDTCSEEKYRTI